MELIFSLPTDLSVRDDARRQAVRACSIRHPALVDVIGAQLVPGGILVQYAEPREAVPVEAGAVPFGDADAALRILAPIAAGLAHLHDAGLGHGGVALGNIMVRDDGAGLLVGWRPRASIAQDVADLCDVALTLLPPGSVHAELAQPLVLGSDSDPQVRPSMARLAAAFEAARRHPPASPIARRTSPSGLVVDGPAGAERDMIGLLRGARAARPTEEAPAGHARHAARRPVRWRWVATAAGVALLAVLGMGAVRASDGPPPDPTEAVVDGVRPSLTCRAESETPRASQHATPRATAREPARERDSAKRQPAPRESPSRPSGRST